MTKKNYSVLGMLAMALAFGLVFAGCDDTSGGGDEKKITVSGWWEYTEGKVVISFSAYKPADIGGTSYSVYIPSVSVDKQAIVKNSFTVKNGGSSVVFAIEDHSLCWESDEPSNETVFTVTYVPPADDSCKLRLFAYTGSGFHEEYAKSFDVACRKR
jgi:hypothetical protein